MFCRGVLLAAAAVYACRASAVVTLFDFETEAERAVAPNVRSADGTVIAVTNSMAPSGSYAIHARKPIARGDELNASGVRFEMKPPVADWRGYDRLVIDLYNDGPSGDWIYVRAVGPDDKWEDGVYGRLSLPAYGYSRWTVPLKWPKGYEPSNITRMLINTSSRPKGFDLRIDGIRLLKPGEKAPAARPRTRQCGK